MRHRQAMRGVELGLICGVLVAAGCADGRDAAAREPNAGRRTDHASMASAETSGEASAADFSEATNTAASNGVAADAQPPAFGVYHLETEGDPANFWLNGGALATYRWSMRGCDYGFAGGGAWKLEGGRMVVSPPPGARTFPWIASDGTSEALKVELEIGPEPGSLIARVEWDPIWQLESPEEQLWMSGGRCLRCDPNVLCTCTHEACVDPT